MQSGLKPLSGLVLRQITVVDFRIGFRNNKKKTAITGFHHRSKINLRAKYFVITMIANGHK
jgi:hypothetical protein